MARNLLQNVKGSKVGINIRRFEAACNDRFLLNILASCPNSMRLPWMLTTSPTTKNRETNPPEVRRNSPQVRTALSGTTVAPFASNSGLLV